MPSGPQSNPARPSAHTNGSKHVCASCHSHRSVFRYRGQVRADSDHDLCMRCYRCARDRQRVWYMGVREW
jgi:hypothetical protein